MNFSPFFSSRHKPVRHISCVRVLASLTMYNVQFPSHIGRSSVSERQLLIATNNPGKSAELRLLLSNCGWQAVTPAEIGIAPVDVVETGRSYLENAISKAVRHADVSQLPSLADDSGLEVDALGGRPGVLSARYGGARAPDPLARNSLLLAELEGVPFGQRGARFRAIVALALPHGEIYVREGKIEGRIAENPRGADGFGYDPIFELLDGRTMAEVGDAKHDFSHRARAVRAVLPVLTRLASR